MQLLSRIFRKSFTSVSDIRRHLHQAEDQQAPFDFFYHKKISEAPDATFFLAEAADAHLCFKSPDTRPLAPDVSGSVCQCTFPLTLHKNIQSQIYTFSSRLEPLQHDPGGYSIRTALPNRLDKVELRKDIRIGLPQAHRPAIRVWKAKNGVSFNGNFDPALTTHPALFEMTPGNDCMVLLHDLSAGGLKLSLSPHCFPEAAAYLAEDSRLQLWMLLPEIGWRNPIECLLPARTTRIQRTPTGRLEFGLHFLHSAGGHIKLPNSDDWIKYTDNGLQLLVGWIQHRLEEFDSNERAC